MLVLINGIQIVIAEGITVLNFLSDTSKIFLLAKTLIFGLEVTLICLAAGFFAAAGIWTAGKKLRSILIYTFIFFIPLPFCIHSLAWMETWIAVNNTFGRILKLTGWNISIFVQVLSLLPLSIVILYFRLASLPSSLTEPAVLIADDLKIFKKIIFPQCRPAFAAAGIIIFIMSFNEYAIPSVFGLTTYSMEIFTQYSSSMDGGKSFIASIPMIAIGFMLSYFFMKIIKEELYKNSAVEKKISPGKYPVIFIVLSKGFLAAALICAAVPVIILIIKSDFSSGNFILSEDGGNDIATTLSICIAAALLSLPVMYTAAVYLQKKKENIFVWVLTFLPAFIPSSLTGAALVEFWNRPVLDFFYGGILMPVLAVMIRFMPFGIILISDALEKIDDDKLRIAAVLGAGRLRITAGIIVPEIKKTLMLASGVVFMLGTGELGATIMVIPPGWSTFTVRLYGYLHYGATEKIAEISLIMITGIFCSGIVLKKAYGRYMK